MRFTRSPLGASSSARPRAAVFAVGRRIYVACPNGSSSCVTLTDDLGTVPVGSLVDGSEVTIVAWRPGVAGKTRYRVRATDTGIEGWVAVGELRSTKIAIAPAPAAAPQSSNPAPPRVSAFGDSVRRFGQRRE